jgi:hypothetical protein
LESRDRWGNVPLDDAIRSRSAEIIQLLQAKSITPASRDSDSDSEVRIPLLTAAAAVAPTDATRAGKTTAGVREFLRLAALGDVSGVQVRVSPVHAFARVAHPLHQSCLRRGVDPASVDYDCRGGLHVAAAAGSSVVDC